MRRVFCSLLIVVCTCLSLYGGFSVEDTKLLDGNGEPFIFRGVDVPHAWFRKSTKRVLNDVSATGANGVRLVLANGELWEKTSRRELKKLLKWCRERELIAIIEIHDTTGYGDKEGAATIDTAVRYWLEMQDVLKGTEDYVVLNIANEPLGNENPESLWAEIHIEAIRQLREAGFTHTLMVDMPNWGQDWQRHGPKHAMEIFKSDPLANTVFSVHMYDVFSNEEKVKSYIESMVDQKLCLVIGEFAQTHFGMPIAAEAIMKWAQHYGIGYLGWSWCGNSGELVDLDIVKGFKNPELTPWGELLVDGPNGIRATSRKATVFTGQD